MENFLAVAILGEDGGTVWSASTASTDPQDVANGLAAAGGGNFPDQILLIRNGDKYPDPVVHWRVGEDYEVD